MNGFAKYRLYNNQTGDVIYLLNIINDPEVDHEERKEKKKVDMMYKKDIPHENLSWEDLPS